MQPFAQNPAGRNRSLLAKRRRLGPQSVVSVAHEDQQEHCLPAQQKATDAEILRWTLTKEAIAPCFVRDVLTLRDGGNGKDADFFWLGHVPCRTVALVGLVVGVVSYERRTLYTLDDGTGVIDCIHRVSKVSNPLANLKPASAVSAKVAPKVSSPAHNAYLENAAEDFGFNALFVDPLSPQDTSGRIRVGTFVRVVGRVSKWHEGKQVIVTTLDGCLSPNEEPAHRCLVRELHRTRYGPEARPFVISQLNGPDSQSTHTTISAPPIPSSPNKRPSPHHLKTPQSSRPNRMPTHDPHSHPESESEISNPDDSDYSTTAGSSPLKSVYNEPLPLQRPKLRHPSRLHSHDLTANTFKIYLKHYMDNSQLVTTPSPVPVSDDELANDDGDEECGFTTPTRKLRTAPTNSTGTPRQSYHITQLIYQARDKTPKPINRDKKSNLTAGWTSQMQGITMSYLRRVPELAYMARRVVEVEAKRRAREEKRTAKDRSQKAGSSRNEDNKENNRRVKGKEREVTRKADREKLGTKMKRLFAFAIRKLYEEGSIVLFDGPSRSCSTLTSGMDEAAGITGGLWKISSTMGCNATSGVDSSVFSRSSASVFPEADNEDDGVLTDPREDEESYISLTPAYLSPAVDYAMKVLAERGNSRAAQNSEQNPTSRSHSWDMSASGSGSTAKQITSYLKRSDGRWVRLGVWTVEETLQEMKRRGSIWCIGGKGAEAKWERCL